MTQNGQAYHFIFMLRQCVALVFSAANATSVNLFFCKSFNLAKFDTNDLKAQKNILVLFRKKMLIR